jgi:hypothetical protein
MRQNAAIKTSFMDRTVKVSQGFLPKRSQLMVCSTKMHVSPKNKPEETYTTARRGMKLTNELRLNLLDQNTIVCVISISIHMYSRSNNKIPFFHFGQSIFRAVESRSL